MIYNILLFHLIPTLRQPVPLVFATNLFIYMGYFVGLTRSYGATPGKKWLKLRIVDDSGAALSNKQAVQRAFVMLIPFIPFMYFYYIFWPHMLIDYADYRTGTGHMHDIMQAGGHLTPEQQKRWDEFMYYVQDPVNRMLALSVKLTGAALLVWEIIMACHPRKKAIHDMMCETMVISA